MTPIVFLPGTLCDERMWKFQTQNFPNSQVINLRTQNSLQEMLSSIREVSYETFILVGFSLGGYVAQEFALSDPQRVEHLVLIGSSAHTYPEKEKALALMAIPLIEKGLFKGITEKRLKQFLHPDAYAKTELRELIHSMSGSDAGEVYLRQLHATLERPDLRVQMGQLNCPLTAIAGRDDQIVRVEDIEEFRQTVPTSEVIVIDDCGHFAPLEKPDEVNAILEAIV